MLKPAQQTARQLAWLTAHGVAAMDLAVQRVSGSWLAPHQGIAPDAVAHLLPWCHAENARGANIYIRPHRHSAVPVVFLDDVTSSAAMLLAEQHPALVVETSPNRCHVWLAVERELAERERFAVQATLAARSVNDQPLADRGSISGDHYGRLCGFRNRKRGRDCWVNLRFAGDCGAPFATAPSVEQSASSVISTAGGRVEPGGAEAPRQRGHASESERDWAWVMSKLEQGIDAARLTQALADRSGARRGMDAERYATRTVQRAVERVRRKVAERG